MKQRIFPIVLIILLLALAACGGAPSSESTEAPPAATVAATITATEPPPATSVPTVPQPIVTRPGSNYVLLLPRESAVPADWVMNPQPSYETRDPQPGDTYRFACLDLPSRAVGQAAVGYRHLEGLPSVHIEYVIYPTPDDAAAALADMEQAVAECPEFSIGQGDGAVAAGFTTLAFPAYADDAFAAALSTEGGASGSLLTHMIKVRSGHVVIGINHANYAGADPPDVALTESLVALATSNLKDGPAAPGE